MLELYQFEMSHYCEKVRLILDYKELPYRKVDVNLGLGQLELYRMSGQRLVPVLKDGNEIVADSTAIAEYLDRQYPDKPILPAAPHKRSLCLLMEAWADEFVGLKSRAALLQALGQDRSLRDAALAAAVPDVFKGFVDSVPHFFKEWVAPVPNLFNDLGTAFLQGLTPGTESKIDKTLRSELTILSTLLQTTPYLLGETPTLVDFAVAGLTMYVKFPDSPHLHIPDSLRGKGVAGLADNPDYDTFFNWRDRLYAQYRRPLEMDESEKTVPETIEIQ